MLVARINTRILITLGLSSLLCSIMLFALFSDRIPDRAAAVREGRAAVSELVAAATSFHVARNDLAPLQDLLAFLRQRNTDLVSAAVRRADGSVSAQTGEHERAWLLKSQEPSTAANIQVPVYVDERRWGQVELAFSPLAPDAWWSFVADERIQLIALIVAAAFVAFYFYLGRALKELDPRRAVPARVRAALDTLSEGLLILDHKAAVMLANDAFARIVGQDAERLLGSQANGFGWCDNQGRALSAEQLPWHAALTRGVAVRHESVFMQDAGSKRRAFLASATPISQQTERIAGVLVSFHDITSLRETQDQLSLAKDAADSANRAKSEFLANMSHEIRTPMNAVLGFTQLLRRGYHKNEADSRKYLDTIYSSGKHLLDLINDILDLAKVEAGRLDLETMECSFYAVVREVMEVLSGKAQEKGIALEISCEGKVPESVMTDPTRLRQVVTNLVGNAIKFTTNGQVRVVLSATQQRGRVTVQIDVIDTGPGIAEDRLESIFEPFVQADGSVTRRFGGTGLGLTISRRIARAMGGDLKASSQLGKGSVFRLWFDGGESSAERWVTQAHLAARWIGADTESPAPSWKFLPTRVLVVDDGQSNRELVRLVLEGAGLKVDEAVDGEEAVRLALAHRYAVILMDMQMPVLDGFAATRKLRQQGMDRPIIALTAHAMKGYEQEIMAAGCSAYVAKPIDLDELMKSVAKFVGSAVDTRVPPMDTPKRLATGPSLDQVVSSFSGHPTLRSVARRFALQLKDKVKDMDSAWQAREFSRLAEIAHWLKGSGGTAGYAAFTTPAARLGETAKLQDADRTRLALEEIHGLVARMEIPDEQPSRSMAS